MCSILMHLLYLEGQSPQQSLDLNSESNFDRSPSILGLSVLLWIYDTLSQAINEQLVFKMYIKKATWNAVRC